MWVSRRTDYATRAILALAVADGGPLKLEEIAETAEAPRSVLEQVSLADVVARELPEHVREMLADEDAWVSH